jgi:simple sugar transport system permease protein
MTTLVQGSRRQAGALARFAGVLALALMAFALLLLAFGKNPLDAYAAIFESTLGSYYGVTEVLVKVIPLTLTAAAVLLPARIGLVNVGGEGQLYMGAWLGTWGALTFGHLPQPIALPLVLLLSFVGGGLWALIPAYLRARGWLNEVISTLLLNYVAIQLVNYFIFGPWRDPESANFPQTPRFADSVRLPSIGESRLHLGLFIALATIVAIYLVLRYTRWGYEMRAIGGNPVATRRHGFPISRYILVTMFVAGGLAGLAGAGEILALQGRLRPAFSPDYGYIGFLISWLAGHNPIGVVVMSFLMAIITFGGDALQITQGMPFASVKILMALILFIVLGGFFNSKKRA